MSENEGKGDKSTTEKKLIIEHRIGDLPKKNDTTPKKPEKPTTPPTIDNTGIEEFQKKMKELETSKDTEIQELQGKITELTGQLEKGKEVETELEKAKAQLLALATKEFEAQKKMIVDVVREQLGDEKAEEVGEKITDVQKLESAKIWINYLSEAVKKDTGTGEGKEDGEDSTEGATEGGEKEEGSKVPAGKATREPAKISKEHESSFHLIDELTGTIMSRTATPEAKAVATRKLDTLLQSMVIGYQKRGAPHIPIKTDIARCGSCGKEVFATEGGSCPLCNAKMKGKATFLEELR